MTIKGGIIETKELGVAISLNGEYYNTELVNGKLSLKLKSGSQSIYEDSGFWISEIINIGDNFKDFDKFISQIDIDENSEVIIETRTSSNGIDFDTWMLIGENNEIISSKNRYIQTRITIKAGQEFNSVEIDKVEYTNEIVEVISDGSGSLLKIKKDFIFDMTIDNTWTDEGSLHRKKITRDEWLRIDKLNVDFK